MTQLGNAPDTDVPSPASRRRHVVQWAAATLGLGLAVARVATVDPNRPGHYPLCPFLAVTGEYCPGCGGLRAVHDLAHLDLAGALARNPFVVLVVVPLTAYWWVWLSRRALGRTVKPIASIRPWILWAALGFVLVYWVTRNLPGWTWLSPA